ncbi:MAG: hypothetical protein HC886_03790 [Leptolyngbyaceae cyanobacterium SM1_1_3]|nr:hypothetical protein [Leptolyngbyaceae cyanobacterium SM1_1_3]NJN03626.1 hypothetical protein [Leptolyngbyaceae cyanobacterium RM1_1_2]
MDRQHQLEAKKQPRSNRMVLIGAPDWVKGMIGRLHAIGFVEVSRWSRPERTKQADEVISLWAQQRRDTQR